MITLNPYSRLDFNSCVMLLSTTHEHIMDQGKLENCYNRGIRNINLLQYGPSVPQRFEPDYQAEYVDFTSATDLTKITKLGPKRLYSDFVDKDGNNVSLSNIVVVPNCEHVNIKNYPYMLHANFLGSEFGDPGWYKQDGDTQSGVQWRIDHPIITDYELFDGVLDNLPFGKVFGTLNHPTDGITSYSITDQFIDHSQGIIKAVEIFNRGYQRPTNQSFEDYYDYLLMKDYRLWCTAVVDWQLDTHQFYYDDLGANLLILPSNFNELSYSGKQNAILDAYIGGHYFPVGWGTLAITDIKTVGNKINVTFNKAANSVYGIFDGNKKLLGGNTTHVEIDTSKASKYVRLKALGDGDEFIFTNPIFVNNKATRNSYKVLL